MMESPKAGDWHTRLGFRFRGIGFLAELIEGWMTVTVDRTRGIEAGDA